MHQPANTCQSQFSWGHATCISLDVCGSPSGDNRHANGNTHPPTQAESQTRFPYGARLGSRTRPHCAPTPQSRASLSAHRRAGVSVRCAVPARVASRATSNDHCAVDRALPPPPHLWPTTPTVTQRATATLVIIRCELHACAAPTSPPCSLPSLRSSAPRPTPRHITWALRRTHRHPCLQL